MKLIKPVDITDVMITACSVAGNEYAAWSIATAYAIDQRCIYGHKIYKCISPNTGAQPDLNSWGTAPVWLDEGYTNRWRMFDPATGSQTTANESISVSLHAGVVVDSLAILDVNATSIHIEMTDPVEGLVYSETLDMVNKTNVIDGFTYFFAPIITDHAACILCMPPYLNATVSITVANTGGVAAIGTLVIGSQKDLGFTQYNPTISITDYSTKTTDVFGNTSVVKRSYAKRMTCETMLNNTDVDDLQLALAEYRSTPVVWIGADSRFASMIIYGFYKSFTITIPYPDEATCSIEVEGLI